MCWVRTHQRFVQKLSCHRFGCAIIAHPGIISKCLNGRRLLLLAFAVFHTCQVFCFHLKIMLCKNMIYDILMATVTLVFDILPAKPTLTHMGWCSCNMPRNSPGQSLWETSNYICTYLFDMSPGKYARLKRLSSSSCFIALLQFRNRKYICTRYHFN